MSFKIGGFQKTSFIDYPDKIAAIVFTQGCNFKCGYCHNPELVKCENPEFSQEKILEFLSKRKKLLDAVVISGGEPTLQNGLVDFCIKVKQLGYLVKLDSNGSKFNILKALVDNGLVDYVAMDIKAPIEKYSFVTNSSVNIDNIKSSIDFLLSSNIAYEFRTTVTRELTSVDDLINISKTIKGADKYYLQKFVASKVLDEKFENYTTYTELEFLKIKEILEKFVNSVEIR